MKTETRFSIIKPGHKALPELFFFLAILLFLNGHLVGLNPIDAFIFYPDREWWRFFTWPFVHVSLYHLILDAGAFFILLRCLKESPLKSRLTSVGFCGAGSLAAALVMSPEISAIGLCGLSGIAHGLMFIVALQMITREKDRFTGFCLAGLLTGKCIYEVITGNAAFASLHAGQYGMPILSCHLGGIIGGAIGESRNFINIRRQ